MDDVLGMVRAINQAEETVSPTSAANKNGVRRSSAGGNLNCYLEAPASRGTASPKAWVPVTQDWTRSSDGS